MSTFTGSALNGLFKELYREPFPKIGITRVPNIWDFIYYEKYSCIKCQEEYHLNEIGCKCFIKQTKLGKVIYK